MSAGLALLSRAAVADLGLNRNKGRTRGIRLCLLDGSADGIQVIAVLHSQQLESKRLHALLHVLRKCDVRASLNGNLIGIVEHDQLAKAQGPCQGKCLGGNTFHHAAVPAQHVSIMVNHRVSVLVKHGCQMGLSHRHAHGHAHTCAQGSCGGLNANRMSVFRMSRCQGIHLTEIHHVFLGQAISKQMKQRVKKG